MSKRKYFLLLSLLLNVVLIFILVAKLQAPSVKEISDDKDIFDEKNLEASKIATPQVIGEKSDETVVAVDDGKLSDKSETKQKVLVTKVVDGDTIVIEGGEVVRYIGIDTPETVHPSKDVGCFGKESSQMNKDLVEGKYIYLEKDFSERDKYQRLLRYVWVGESFVNDYLVREGYASAVSYPPDIKYQEQFRQAQNEARESGRGLWSLCGGEKVENVEQVEQLRQRTGMSDDKDCGDFKTHDEAQNFFISQGGPGSDSHKLDQDHDGVACESLP